MNGKRLYLIGKKTYETVNECFQIKNCEIEFPSQKTSAASIVKQLLESDVNDNPNSILRICGYTLTDEENILLNCTKNKIKYLQIYSQIDNLERIKNFLSTSSTILGQNTPVAFVFFSPSSFKVFQQCNGIQYLRKDYHTIVAIGQTTADFIKKFLSFKIYVCNKPDENSLLNILNEIFHKSWFKLIWLKIN